MLFGIIPLSSGESKQYRQIWEERARATARMMGMVGHKCGFGTDTCPECWEDETHLIAT